MIIYNEPKYMFVEHILEKEISYILSKNIEEKMNRFKSVAKLCNEAGQQIQAASLTGAQVQRNEFCRQSRGKGGLRH